MNVHSKLIPKRTKLDRRAVSTMPRTKLIMRPAGSDWTYYELWIRAALDLYCQYPEVVQPLVGDDGEPVLDAFGRYKETPGVRNIDRIKKGAVWLTKDTLRSAWREVFGQSFYKHDQPEKFRVTLNTAGLSDEQVADALAHHSQYHDPRRKKQKREWRAPEDRSSSHPMDQLFGRMRRDGRVIVSKKGSYFFSPEVCAEAGRPDAWELHLTRGMRWEGLEYFTEETPVKELKHHPTTVDDRGTVLMRRPRSVTTGYRNVGHMLWDNIYPLLDPYALFDQEVLFRVAVAEGVLTEDQREHSSLSDHLTLWARKGMIVRKFPRTYQSVRFADWNEQRSAEEKPKQPIVNDWMMAFVFHWVKRQYQMPVLYFTVDTIIEWLETKASKVRVAEWWPVGIRRATITERILRWKDKGHFSYVGMGKFRLSSEALNTLKPLFTSAAPKDMKSRTLPLALRESQMAMMPVSQALEQLTHGEDHRILLTLWDRLVQEGLSDPALYEEYSNKFLRKMKMTFAYWMNQMPDLRTRLSKYEGEGYDD